MKTPEQKMEYQFTRSKLLRCQSNKPHGGEYSLLLANARI